ncbi:PLAC8 family protein [Striga hermonthica]|uniref:PLAC8 family protein n=1 Tax=Striga hermonthica TaxID=68872 RepID=A0A9N7NUQ5_STRHE|nr:PLAC8 family protein [Striga hermonthica]
MVSALCEKDFEVKIPQEIDMEGIDSLNVDAFEGMLALSCAYESRFVIWVMMQGLLSSMAPCVLYGTNVERLGLTPNNTFANHCLPYTGFYLLGQTFFGWNCLAPWFSYPVRTAIRRKFNLEGSCETLTRSCSCLGSFVEDEDQREQCETACDFGAHILCHTCALCQEGREIRRRLPHPGFNSRPVLVMIPPPVQAMGNRE